MKKSKIATAVLAAVVAMGAAGCSLTEEKIAGKYEATVDQAENSGLDKDMLESLGAEDIMVLTYTLQINDDDSCSMTVSNAYVGEEEAACVVNKKEKKLVFSTDSVALSPEDEGTDSGTQEIGYEKVEDNKLKITALEEDGETIVMDKVE